MHARTTAALVFVALAGTALGGQENRSDVNGGDHIVIRMTGDLARAYARRIDPSRQNEVPAGVQISTTATVAQKIGDGRVRIEHFSHIKRNGNVTRLVSLTATVDVTKIVTDVTPENTPVYRSPADHGNGVKPTLTRRDQKTCRLELSELKGLKLRTWTLAEEIGE
ncbi:MAG: hypothetical protein H8E44_25365 [Planctomycetes bacterium]|nr:hypothetical protein [Planctomycetota bacterium]MBL7040224.1 hypothetical protein [Pirellulaceae bacterium]